MKHLYKRTERGRIENLEETARDIEYLYNLFVFGPLETPTLHKLVAPDVTQRVTRYRLCKLNRVPYAYVDKPRRQREIEGANYRHLIYDISDQGTALLLARHRITPEMVEWREKIRASREADFWHDRLIADFGANVALSLPEGYHFGSRYEILERAPEITRASERPLTIEISKKEHITPDDIFFIEGTNSFTFFIIEADRATMPAKREGKGSSFGRKLPRYKQAVETDLIRKHFGFTSPFRILTLTTSPRHMTSLVAQLDRRILKGDWREHAAFKAAPIFDPFKKRLAKPVNLLTDWQRVGHQPLQLI